MLSAYFLLVVASFENLFEHLIFNSRLFSIRSLTNFPSIILNASTIFLLLFTCTFSSSPWLGNISSQIKYFLNFHYFTRACAYLFRRLSSDCEYHSALLLPNTFLIKIITIIVNLFHYNTLKLPLVIQKLSFDRYFAIA